MLLLVCKDHFKYFKGKSIKFLLVEIRHKVTIIGVVSKLNVDDGLQHHAHNASKSFRICVEAAAESHNNLEILLRDIQPKEEHISHMEAQMD